MFIVTNNTWFVEQQSCHSCCPPSDFIAIIHPPFVLAGYSEVHGLHPGILAASRFISRSGGLHHQSTRHTLAEVQYCKLAVTICTRDPGARHNWY